MRRTPTHLRRQAAVATPPPPPPSTTTTTTTTPPPPPISAAAAALAHHILTTPTPHTLPSSSLSPPVINQTLKLLSNHAPKALSFFQTLIQSKTLIPISSFNIAIDIAARSRAYPFLWRLLKHHIPSFNLTPNHTTFAIIFERYVEAKKPDRAITVFLNMHKYNFPQDRITFNILISVLCKAKMVEKAAGLVRVYGGRFGGLDDVSYSVLANGWCLVGKMGKAIMVMKEMVEKGLRPSVGCYNVVLKGFFRAGRVEEAWGFYVEMRRRNVEVDVVTYTTLVHGFGSAGEVRRARNVLEKMVEEGVLPTVATYNAFIMVLCKKDGVEKAMLVFEEMVRKGYVANSITYNLLVKGFCREGEMERAVEFVGRMERDGCEPNVQTYNLLIRYYCDKGELEKGVDMFHKMSRGGCLPNRDTYNVLISRMFIRKKMEDLVLAGELLIEMVERGFLPARFTFNRVLNGLLLTGNQAFAKEILRLQSTGGRLPRHFRL